MSAWREVTSEQFYATMRYATKRQAMAGFDHEFSGDDVFPAGIRCFHCLNKGIGNAVGFSINTGSVTRHWVAAHLPLKTQAQWLAEWEESFRANIAAWMEPVRLENEATAERLCISIQDARAMRASADVYARYARMNVGNGSRDDYDINRGEVRLRRHRQSEGY